jgi:hypothetical protein
MSFTGTWIITLNLPTGAQTLTFTAQDTGGALTGTITNGTDSGDIVNGRVEGDEARWNLPIRKPMPLTLAFSALLADDELTGKAQVGGLGSAKFSAVRQ